MAHSPSKMDVPTKAWTFCPPGIFETADNRMECYYDCYDALAWKALSTNAAHTVVRSGTKPHETHPRKHHNNQKRRLLMGTNTRSIQYG